MYLSASQVPTDWRASYFVAQKLSEGARLWRDPDSGEITLRQSQSGWQRVPCAAGLCSGSKRTAAVAVTRIEPVTQAVLTANETANKWRTHYASRPWQYPAPAARGMAVRYNLLTARPVAGPDGAAMREYIAPTAYDVEYRNADLLVAHKRQYRLASTRDGTLTLTNLPDGVLAEFSLLDHNPEVGLAAMHLMRRRQLRGFSFVLGPGCQYRLRSLPSGETVREVYGAFSDEFTVTSSPAYPWEYSELRCSAYNHGRADRDLVAELLLVDKT